MNGLAALLALALVQSPEAQPAPAPDPEAPPPAGAQPPPAPQRPPAQFAPAPPTPEPEPSRALPLPEPEPETKPSPAAPAPVGTPRTRRSPAAPAPASTPPPAAPTGAGPATPPAAARPPTPLAPPAAAPVAVPGPATPPAPPAAPKEAKPSPDRVQVAAAAARFFQALLARRPADLAALCALTFSFDGKLVSGADAIRARWADLVAAHGGAMYTLLDLEILALADAQARYGKPPKRLAALAAPGSWVALGNLSGRPTFVFYSRQGNAWLATGIHD